MLDPGVWVVIAAGVAAIIGALVAVGKLTQWVWRTGRRLGHLVDDLTGEPERPGHAARPGLMERVTTLEERTKELKPNGGGSIKDQISRIDGRLARVEQRLGGPDGDGS